MSADPSPEQRPEESAADSGDGAPSFSTDWRLSRPSGASVRLRWALALTATFTMAVSYVDRQTLAVLAPTVTSALTISETAYGWLVSAFSIAYLAGAPLAGRLVDRLGARRGLLGAVVVWSIVAAAHAIVPGFGVLFLLRIALGLAESPSFPGAAQTVHRALPPAERARGLGILFTGSSFGAMIAPPLATFFEARWGWRIAFLVTAIVGLVWIPIWLAVAFSSEGRRTLDAKPAETAPAQRGSRPSLPSLVVDPAVARALLVVVASSPLIAFFLNWGSKLLVAEHGLTQADVGRFLWVPPVFFDAGSILFGHVASVRARKGTGAPERGLLAGAALLVLTGVALPLARGPWEAMLIAGLAMAGGGGLFALLTADMLSRVRPDVVSSAGGLSAAAQSLAYIVANPLIGAAVERSGSYNAVAVALALWVIPGCAAWILWKPPPIWRERAEPRAT